MKAFRAATRTLMRSLTLGLIGLQVAALAGCGSPQAQAPSPATPTVETKAASARAPTPSAAPKAGESLSEDDAPPFSDGLSIFVVDVGQGDSTVVLGPPSKL